MDIDQLNKDYGIVDQLKFILGNGSLPMILISNKSAKALISLYGGQVLSFQPMGEYEDLLFLSKNAYYNGKKAIRGGIPVCWPWFGQDPKGLLRPNHGFARNSFWAVTETEASTDFKTKIKLRLIQTAENRYLWPHSFDLILAITIGSTLNLELVTRNTGDKSFSITQALHSYFRIGDIERVKVLGLEENEYLDKLDDAKQKKQMGAVTFLEEVDRIYSGVQSQLNIEDSIIKRRICITSLGNNTAVLWNPWAKTSKKMPDLEANGYKRFVCVEACNAATDVIEISPGSKYSLLTNFKILREE